jgi:hypothetical protein
LWIAAMMSTASGVSFSSGADSRVGPLEDRAVEVPGTTVRVAQSRGHDSPVAGVESLAPELV